MSAAPDLADRNVAGELREETLLEGAKPLNEAARKKHEETPRVLSVKQLIKSSMERAFNRETKKYCTTLHYKLDFATGGYRPGHTWVFGADTNWGKSTYFVAVLNENINNGKRGLIVSVEDDETLYGDRLMAIRSRVNFSRLRDSRLREEEMNAVADVAARAEDKPVFLDGRGKTVETICKQANALIKAEGIDIIGFDYLQEFRTERQYKDERVKFRDIASQLRGVIKDNKITGVILSQITVTEGKKFPDKHSIRESRDVSNAAEVVALGYTTSQPIMKNDSEGKPTGEVLIPAGAKVIKIDKAKDGQKVIVEMPWDKNSACFDVAPRPYGREIDELYSDFQDGL